MTDRIAVHIGRETPQSVSVADAFETSGSFELAIQNHGAPAHVHLHVDDSLARAAELDAVNHYVEGDTARVVSVAATEFSGPVTGTLEIVTGYGAESDAVSVTVSEPPTVVVDESLSEPKRTPAARSTFDAESAPVAVAAVAAVGLFVVVVSLVSEWTALVVGVIAVLAGLGLAAYLLSES